MPVKKGDKIKVEYTGTLDDGKVFDTTEGKHPLEFEAGTGKVIPGFDNAVIGMEKGEEKQVKLKADEAYGQHNPQLIKKIPRQAIKQGPEPQPGMMLGIKTPDGMQLPAKIVEVNENEITIDVNPPLAGKDLNFKIKVVDIL